jgi:hypothetical protein
MTQRGFNLCRHVRFSYKWYEKSFVDDRMFVIPSPAPSILLVAEVLSLAGRKMMELVEPCPPRFSDAGRFQNCNH